MILKKILFFLILIISISFVYGAAICPSTNVKSGWQTGFSCDANANNVT